VTFSICCCCLFLPTSRGWDGCKPNHGRKLALRCMRARIQQPWTAVSAISAPACARAMCMGLGLKVPKYTAKTVKICIQRCGPLLMMPSAATVIRKPQAKPCRTACTCTGYTALKSQHSTAQHSTARTHTYRFIGEAPSSSQAIATVAAVWVRDSDNRCGLQVSGGAVLQLPQKRPKQCITSIHPQPNLPCADTANAGNAFRKTPACNCNGTKLNGTDSSTNKQQGSACSRQTTATTGGPSCSSSRGQPQTSIELL
jgi:hypothetical protein